MKLLLLYDSAMPTPPSVGESMADAEVAIVVPAVDADKAEKSVISSPAATEPLERLDPPTGNSGGSRASEGHWRGLRGDAISDR